MPYPQWPGNVPYQIEFNGHEPIKPIDTTLRSPKESQGQKQARKQSFLKFQTYKGTLSLTHEELRYFQLFYKNTLNHGRKHFEMPLWNTKGYETYVAMFNMPYTQVPQGYGRFSIGLDLHVRNAPIYRSVV
jgi:hypothetical protein